MFDKEIALDSLVKIRTVIETIVERTASVDNPNDFFVRQMVCYDWMLSA